MRLVPHFLVSTVDVQEGNHRHVGGFVANLNKNFLIVAWCEPFDRLGNQTNLFHGREHRTNHGLQTIGTPPRRDPHATPSMTLIPGEVHQQNHGALVQIAVIALASPPGHINHGTRCSRHFTRKGTNDICVKPRHLGCLLRRVLLVQLGLDHVEHGLHFHHLAIGQLDLERTGKCGLDAAELETATAFTITFATRRDDGLFLRLVPDVKGIIRTALDHVGSPQETMIILTHEEGEIGLFENVILLVQVFRNHHLCSGQPQSGIRLGDHIDPHIGVHRRRIQVGCHHHQLGTAITGFVQKVRFRNTRVNRVPDPDHDEVRTEPVIRRAFAVVHPPSLYSTHRHVRNTRPGVNLGGFDGIRESYITCSFRAITGVGRAVVKDDAFSPVCHCCIDQLVGDFRQSFVPGDALPFAFATFADALQRILDTRFGNLKLCITRTLLASAWVEVRNIRTMWLIDCRLLFTPGNAVAHIDIP